MTTFSNFNKSVPDTISFDVRNDFSSSFVNALILLLMFKQFHLTLKTI